MEIAKNISSYFNKKILLTLLVAIAITFLSINTVFSNNNAYTNQLLNLNFEKISEDDVNLNLYTSKPFKMKLNVIKKNSNQYIIFLPETYHSITSKPSLVQVYDSIHDINVKLIPFVGSTANNGYTKIIVTTYPDTRLKVLTQVHKEKNLLNDELSKLIISNKMIESLNPKVAEKPVKTVKPKPEKAAKKKVYKKAYKPAPVKKKRVAVHKEQNIKPVNLQKEVPIENKVINENNTAEYIFNQVNDELIKDLENAKPTVKHKKSSGSLLGWIFKIAAAIIFIFILLGLLGRRKASNHNNEFESSKNSTFEPEDDLFAEPLEQEPQEDYAPSFNQVEQEPQHVEKQSEEILQTTQHVAENPDDTSYMYEEDLFDYEVGATPQSKEQEPVYETSNIQTVEEPQDENILGGEVSVIDGIDINESAGIYLVQTEIDKALIGIIGPNVFILERFDDFELTNFNINMIDVVEGVGYYLAVIEDWKAAISVTPQSIDIVETY